MDSEKLKQWIRAWKKEMDYIIVDCSPAAVSTDAEVWMNVVDSVLLVVKEDYADVRTINDTVDAVWQSGKDFAGFVLNAFHREWFWGWMSADTEVTAMADHRREIETEMHNDEMEIDLGRLFLGMWKSFRKLWWMVLALALAGALLFTVYQRVFREPVYACTATFTVTTGDESSGSYSFYYDSTTADQMSKTFPYVLESGFFRNALMEQLGTDTLNGTITAETIEDSNVVTMRAESPDAGSARISWMRRWRSIPRPPGSCWARSDLTCWMNRRRRMHRTIR